MMQSLTEAETFQRLLQLRWGFAPPLIIETAVRIGLFEAFERQPMTLAEAAAATECSPRGVRAIVETLAALELLEKDGARYRLAPPAAKNLVRSAGSANLGEQFRYTSTQLLPGWMRLAEAVRGGGPIASAAWDKQCGPFAAFVEGLMPFGHAGAVALSRHLGLREGRVLDLAAGSAVWSLPFAEASPAIRVTAVDWPNVLDVTRAITASRGVAGQYEFIAGDLATVDFGSGYALATLGHILHSEGEQRSRALLAKTFDALAPGGSIAIAEYLLDDDRTGPLAGLIFAVNMLIYTEAGDTWPASEIAAWLSDAGFTDVRLLDVPVVSPLILATKPS